MPNSEAEIKKLFAGITKSEMFVLNNCLRYFVRLENIDKTPEISHISLTANKDLSKEQLSEQISNLIKLQNENKLEEFKDF